MTDPKNFLKEPLAPVYDYFKGGARAKKRNFLGEFFQKVPKNAFLARFLFKILPVSQKFWPKQERFSVLEELGKPIWST